MFDGNHEVVLDDAILLDGFIKRVPHDYYRKFQGKNAFLVHFLDETYEGGYERYDYFRGVIRNFWSPAFNPRKVFILPTGYRDPPNRSSRRSRPPRDESTSGPSTASSARAAGLMPSRR